jgi:hypothetical protein
MEELFDHLETDHEDVLALEWLPMHLLDWCHGYVHDEDRIPSFYEAPMSQSERVAIEFKVEAGLVAL